MICRCFGHSVDLGMIGKRLRETADLMVGVPDYDAYVAHVQARHPDAAVMSRDAFFRERQSARYGYGEGRFRCC
jgi:uncharacterized short protein YbdD (DUF466 family)